MSLAEVAKRAGVSVATASRVLSNSAYFVSPELKERVLEAARAANHVPDEAARALSNREGSTIGIIIGDVRDAYYAELVHGVQTVLEENGRLLYICSSHWNPAKEAGFIRMLHSNRVAAIIITCSEIPDPVQTPRIAEYLDAFRNSGGVVVTLGRRTKQARKVFPDNVVGARTMGEALLGLGHRHFGIISGVKGTVSRDERLAGFRAALKAAGVSQRHTHVVESDRSSDGGARAAKQLMEAHPDITCIFALNDKMALGAMTQMQRMGIRVPEDVSIAGFDDIAAARQSHPLLSTVRIDLPQMSDRLALAALAGRQDAPIDSTVIVPTTLVMRDSTAAVRTHQLRSSVLSMASS